MQTDGYYNITCSSTTVPFVETVTTRKSGGKTWQTSG